MTVILTAAITTAFSWTGAWWVCRHPEQFARVGAGSGKRRAVDAVSRLTAELAQEKQDRELDDTRHEKELGGFRSALDLAAKQNAELGRENQDLLHQLAQFSSVPETAPQLAAIDRPDFQPEPADPPTPDRDRDQLPPIALTLPRPETYEPASLVEATRRDESLRSLALPGEEEMAAELEAMRAKVRAKAEAHTQLNIRIPERPAIPDEAAIRLNIPGPHPLASATAIPKTAVDNAVTKVHATVSEAP